MKNIFEFNIDEDSHIFCEEIISEMIKLFNLKRNEAIGRINSLWKEVDFIGQEDIRYHETIDFWANEIYYGHDSYWWTNPDNLKPLTYP